MSCICVCVCVTPCLFIHRWSTYNKSILVCRLVWHFGFFLFSLSLFLFYLPHSLPSFCLSCGIIQIAPLPRFSYPSFSHILFPFVESLPILFCFKSLLDCINIFFLFLAIWICVSALKTAVCPKKRERKKWLFKLKDSYETHSHMHMLYIHRMGDRARVVIFRPMVLHTQCHQMQQIIQPNTRFCVKCQRCTKLTSMCQIVLLSFVCFRRRRHI